MRMVLYIMVDLLWNQISKQHKTKFLLVERSVNSVKDIRILLLVRVWDLIDLMVDNLVEY